MTGKTRINIAICLLFACAFALSSCGKVDKAEGASAKAEEQIVSVSHRIGDTVTFGSFEQDNNLENGTESIEWIVIDVRDGEMMLLSKYGLDVRQFGKPLGSDDWYSSQIRKWLNNDFYSIAFTGEEQACIKETSVYNGEMGVSKYTDAKIFLLSREEVREMRARIPVCEPTEYAKNQHWPNRDTWWLRTSAVKASIGSVYIFDNNEIRISSCDKENIMVRPAMWVREVQETEAQNTQPESEETEKLSYIWRLLEDGTAEIISYLGNDDILYIPEEIEGHTVSAIGNSAFSQKDMVWVTVPGTVKRIGERAFERCSRLEHVRLKEGVERIEYYAFFYCKKLKDLVLPRSITYVDYKALSGSRSALVYVFSWDTADLTSESCVTIDPLVSDDVLYDDLILELPFEGSFEDASGHVNPVVHGDIRFTEGVNGGQGIYLDGEGDYIELGNGFNFLNEYTISIWVKTESSEREYATVFAKYEKNDGPYQYYLNYGRPAMYLSPNGLSSKKAVDYQVKSRIDDTSWHMITYVGTGGVHKVFLDGVEVSESVSQVLRRSNDMVTIGRQALMFEPYDRLEYKGFLDDIKVFSRALTVQEIVALYRFEKQ